MFTTVSPAASNDRDAPTLSAVMRTLLLLAAAGIAARCSVRGRRPRRSFPPSTSSDTRATLIRKPRSRPTKIRFAGAVSYTDEILYAAVAYLKRTAVVFRRVGRFASDAFKNGQTNVYPTSFGGGSWESVQKTGKVAAAFPTPPDVYTYGYWTLAVFVNPANPIASIEIKPLGLAIMRKDSTWKDLGQPSDAPLKFYSIDNCLTLCGSSKCRKIRSSASGDVEAETAGREVECSRGDRQRPRRHGHSVLFSHECRHGAKVVPILDEHGRAVPPSDSRMRSPPAGTPCGSRPSASCIPKPTRPPGSSPAGS